MDSRCCEGPPKFESKQNKLQSKRERASEMAAESKSAEIEP